MPSILFSFFTSFRPTPAVLFLQTNRPRPTKLAVQARMSVRYKKIKTHLRRLSK